MEIAVPEELKEVLSRPEIVSIIEANSYRTRRILTLDINGETGQWHSLKGGVNTLSAMSTEGKLIPIYEVLFNPETRQWLKVVPPETTSQAKLGTRLKESISITQASLRVSNLPELADQVKECRVDMEDKFIRERKNVQGFVSPHIGPSLEYYLRLIKGPKDVVPDNARTFFSQAYQIAFEHARALYENYGFWTEDPNPGNILLYHKDEGIHVVLIDFSNRKQHAEYEFSEVPDATKREQLRTNCIDRLKEKFDRQCTLLGIDSPTN